MNSPIDKHQQDPPVAVIVPTYNGAAFIGEQLTALFEQKCNTEWHLIVVDGGSTDATLDAVENVGPRTVPVTVIRLSGAPGVNAGLNAGVASTTSSIILIAEHDDVVGDGWIQLLVDALQERSLVGTSVDKSLLNEEHLIGSRKRFAEDVHLPVAIADSTGMGFRRSLWEELGGFDESYRFGGNDAEFCFRAHDLGHDVKIVDGAVMHYRIRTDAAGAFRQARAYGVSTVRIYKQFGPQYVQRRALRRVAKEILRLGWWATKAPFDRSYRMRLAYRGGLQVGYLQGSLQYRRWFP